MLIYVKKTPSGYESRDDLRLGSPYLEPMVIWWSLQAVIPVAKRGLLKTGIDCDFEINYDYVLNFIPRDAVPIFLYSVTLGMQIYISEQSKEMKLENYWS